MDERLVIMMDLLFLAIFLLHNLEEAVWLPAFSRQVSHRFFPVVERNKFLVALSVVSAAGAAFVFARLLFSSSAALSYLYYGFVLMMALNSVFPYLLGAIMLRRYVPSTFTGVFGCLPIGL